MSLLFTILILSAVCLNSFLCSIDQWYQRSKDNTLFHQCPNNFSLSPWDKVSHCNILNKCSLILSGQVSPVMLNLHHRLYLCHTISRGQLILSHHTLSNLPHLLIIRCLECPILHHIWYDLTNINSLCVFFWSKDSKLCVLCIFFFFDLKSTAFHTFTCI